MAKMAGRAEGKAAWLRRGVGGNSAGALHKIFSSPWRPKGLFGIGISLRQRREMAAVINNMWHEPMNMTHLNMSACGIRKASFAATAATSCRGALSLIKQMSQA